MKRTALDGWICAVEGLDRLDRPTLAALQLRRLNDLLRRERERGGFYREVPERLERLSELAALPFTTAADLEKNAGAMLLTSQAETARVITERTSGTSGAAKRVFYTAGDCQNTVGFFAAGLSELVFPGESVMIAMPFSGENGLGELISAAILSLGARPLKTGVGRSFGELAEILEREAPAAYVGMPVPLLSLLRFCGGKTPLKRALVSGDACPPGVLEETEKLLGTRLFPHYGSRELGLGGAVTCQAHRGMHLRENHIIAEIVGPDGAVLPEGETGELVITTIGMEAMPLLRYRSGDRARILPGPCPCGGATRRVEVFSRLSEGPDMAALDDALFRLPGLIDYSAAVEGGALFISALGTEMPETIKKAAQRYWTFGGISVGCQEPALSDMPKFVGKRKISSKSSAKKSKISLDVTPV